MDFKIYNTLSRAVEVFEPIEAGKVRLYTCGPTVYNAPHIGNLRSFLFEDVLRRALELFGYEVHHVMNLTDVEDKIIAKAIETGASLDEVTEPHIESFFASLDALQMKRADDYPRATRYVDSMIEIVETLIEKDHAYESDGSVYFRVESFPEYGRLSRIDLSQMRRGERVETDEYEKDDVRDFVLWKSAKAGEPSWPSPWGEGRPGWHIECSAMARDLLGPNIDMHCGGVDNIFPHHENEIAQSECSAEGAFARYWVHAEHLLVDGKKMSKSLGNQYLLQELQEKGISARAVRYLFSSVHYRQKLNFTFQSAAQAISALRRVDDLRARLGRSVKGAAEDGGLADAEDTFRRDFQQAIGEDLNLSGAHGALFQFVREVNRRLDAGPITQAQADSVEGSIRWADSVLGTLIAEDWDAIEESSGPSEDEIEALIGERNEARKTRDFARADTIRDELANRGVLIEDTPAGTTWKRA